MSAAPFIGRTTQAEAEVTQRLQRIEHELQRESELLRLHQRLDALLFWLVVMVALGAIFTQFGLNP